jgi:lipopolysaccharide export LptBFGC system permease protein LptF
MTALVVEANDVWLWGAGLRAHVDTARVVLSDPKLSRRLGSLGPPNSLPTADLDRTDVHHRFTWHRRLALPSMAPLWALIGALLGARLGGARALLCGAAAVTSCYWLLRAGELAARDGFGSAAVAAWAPALTLGLVTALVIRRV